MIADSQRLLLARPHRPATRQSRKSRPASEKSKLQTPGVSSHSLPGRMRKTLTINLADSLTHSCRQETRRISRRLIGRVLMGVSWPRNCARDLEDRTETLEKWTSTANGPNDRKQHTLRHNWIVRGPADLLTEEDEHLARGYGWVQMGEAVSSIYNCQLVNSLQDQSSCNL